MDLSDVSMSPRLCRSIEGKKRELDRLRPLPPTAVRKLQEQFSIEWTYNTNAIEGNTLSLRETEMVVSRGLTIGGKSLREHFEAVNHARAIDWVAAFARRKRELSEELILDLHRAIMSGIDETEAGAYRRHNVRIMGAVHVPPSPAKVQPSMGDLVRWFHEHRRVVSVAASAAAVHYELVRIHPFTDGNGRTARLIMNFVLLRGGYPPAVIANVDRKRYYRVLQEADAGDLRPFADFVGRSIERSLVIYLDALGSAREGDREKRVYVSLREAERYCAYSQEYLSYLARSGRLPAVKFGRNWMTTREAIEEYVKAVGTDSRRDDLAGAPGSR